MKNSLIALYGCLLLSIYLIRSLDLSNKKIDISQYSSYFTQDSTVNEAETYDYRILQDQSSFQNPKVIKICKEASNSTISQSKVSKFNTAYDEYRGAFGPAIGDELIRDQKVPETNKLIQKAIILGILLIFFLITPIITFCYCCYCCCDQKCPCCCKDDIQKNPFTKRQMVYTLICVILFSALTLSTSVAGYIYSSDINSSYKSMKCVVVSSLDNLNLQQNYNTSDGTQANFIGLNGLKTQVNTITSKIDNYVAQINSFATYSSTQSSNIQKVSDSITSMFTALQTVDSSFKTHQKGESSGFSDFSDSTQPSRFYGDTYSNLVNQMVTAQNQASSAAVSAMKEASDQAKSFAQDNQNSNSIKQPLQDALSQISNGQSQINSYINQIDDNSQLTDQVFNLITIFLMAFYGVFIFIAVVGSILSFVGYIKHMLKVRYCLNIFWCLLGLLTFIGFLLCVILGILTIVLMEGCNTTDKIFNDKTYLSSFSQLTADDISYLTTCKASLGGKGDILTKFKIQDKVDTMTETQSDLQKSYDSFDITQYQKFEQYMQFFLNQHLTMQNYGIFTDRSDQDWVTTGPDQLAKYNIILDYDNAVKIYQAQISQLNNSVTSSNAYNCVSSSAYDQFVIKDDQCANNYNNLHPVSQTDFQTGLTGTNCVSWQTISQLPNLQTDTQSRYTSCTTKPWDLFYSKFKTYVAFSTTRYAKSETFNYKDSSNTGQTITLIRSEFINNVIIPQQSSSNADGFGYMLLDFKNKVNSQVLDGSKEISDALTGKQGLLNNVNCLFFGYTLDNLQNTMCADSGLSIYNTFKIMCVLTFSNFILLVYLYKMSMKFLGKKKEQELQMAKPQHQGENIEIVGLKQA
ncbi:transmembrane protein, putative (macronuclear) [Tetrahymena thermophila SB210]|uniref:Transmembrane protein, putative n=1 Tax=Tetrahymena thermophila (strain SB210) TaxID=312017 RepID=I7MCR5_TETTS|nr:transmembrane protein, putative [Tetrahymena thermophila SB210]EAR84789.1 transmembrane protein, putative [Tetrahymena thermophila SB210]|eukprot:XP_001032452.1 transmembrane protein, putative [Tetrahymena thermophila SB210]